MTDDWTGGLPLDIDTMFPGRPEDPEMRESASIWLFEENGAFALPRVGIEAQGAVWDNHRFDMNLAFRGGRVLRESARAATMPAQDGQGRPRVLGAGGMAFRCLEPFRRWHVSYAGEAWEGTVEEQIRAQFGVYADGDRNKGLEGRSRVPVSWEVEIVMAAPAWTQDYREEKLAGMTAREREDAGSMGYGWRIEQLCRGEGRLSVGGEERSFRAVGSRIHRQSVRPMGAFRGHCWQSALFPDGRGFGFITYPPLPGEDPAETYNNGYVVIDGTFHKARVTKIPFLRNVMPEGDDVSIELESALGTHRIAARTVLATFHMGNPGVNGFNNQQGGVLYSWDGVETLGMIERSSPSELCTIRL